MKRFICALTAVLLVLPFISARAEPGVYNWYEVFVRSYQDSDGDGLGDLRGLLSRLDYIQDMGYDGLWLMPVMPSPSYHKYDVTDYMAIDPEYGTMEDMRALVREVHARGMRIIIDLPVNHTSTRHPWFLAAAEALKNNSDSPYINYYHFTLTPDGVPLEGTDWYYEEQFAGGNMPDLALENPTVVEEIRAVLVFWLTDVEVDGFRLDAVTSFFSYDTDANVAFLAEMNSMCRQIKPGSYLVGECWAGLSVIAQYYASGIDSFFLFPASEAEGFIAASLRGRSATHAEKFAKSYQNVLNAIPVGTLAPFLSNHDTGRTIGCVQGRGNLPVAKFAEGVLNMMQGCVFTYYGEEIGMVGSGDDPNKRLAMYWNDGDMTDQPPGVTHLEYAFPSVEAQQTDPDSLLNYCRRVNMARQQVPAIARGENEFVLAAGDVCVMRRTLGTESVLIALNFSGKNSQDCSLPGNASILYDLETGSETAALRGDTLTLPPYAIVILTEE